jgi:hypothetical protein
MQVSGVEEDKFQFWTLVLPVTFLSANFLHFSQRFRNQYRTCNLSKRDFLHTVTLLSVSLFILKLITVMILQDILEDDIVKNILYLADLLEMCQFKIFWQQVSILATSCLKQTTYLLLLLSLLWSTSQAVDTQ